MQRATGTLRIPGLVGLAAVAALGGCAANGGDASILVLKAVAPPTNVSGGVCTFTAAETEAGLTHGVLDVASGLGYQLVAQLRSRITADPDLKDVRTISLRGANVDLAFPDAGQLGAQIADLRQQGLLHFMVPFSMELPPNGSLLDVPFELIPSGVARGVAGALNPAAGFPSTVVQATFTVVGDLAGGDVSSQAFHYSVTLGKQILITDQGPCAALSKTFVPRKGNPCAPGQDFAIDCCESSPTALQCPAVGPGV